MLIPSQLLELSSKPKELQLMIILLDAKSGTLRDKTNTEQLQMLITKELLGQSLFMMLLIKFLFTI